MEKVQPESPSAQPKTESAESPQLQTEPKTEPRTQQVTQPMTQPAVPANNQPAVFYPTSPQQANTVGSPYGPLPPYHPCYRGGHIIESEFTPCGVAWAILCFPWGLICLFHDRRKRCVQCGQVFL
ncbi:hypothetical protein V1520DRAFT_299075 [Lipomyces starkeyi]|uniref:Uncharacterized protein n=1 Tax=Lipomyces starkeyi NRRL Y-11557 TaxID=675824 RepID=A0A1E3QEP8_LIPST|nr:hypothetical protein LIPSTDRAFT_114505 [Lipomyces starkeyi NRRL Y-11557]